MITFKVFIAISVIALANCQYERPIPEGCDNGTRPVYVFNSAYTVLPDGGFCCPLHQSESNCTSEEEVRSICPNGIVYEPCYHCKTCAKGIGEVCGGIYGLQGVCERATLECTVGVETFGYPEENITGFCVTLRTKGIGETCGGPYGSNGRCIQGLKCTAKERKFKAGENITGICLDPTEVNDVCFKDCSVREHSPVCGNDGVLYDNLCYLRQQNCYPPPGRQPPKIKVAEDESVCSAGNSLPDP